MSRFAHVVWVSVVLVCVLASLGQLAASARPRAGSASSLSLPSVPATSPDTLSRDNVVSAPGPVVSLAADGERVAAAVATSRGWCSHVVVWDVARRGIVSFWPSFCAQTKKLPVPDEQGYMNIGEVALAGDRAAWIRTLQPGTYFLQCVETATIGAPRVRSLVGPCDGDDTRFSVTAGDGTWATNIVGAGHLLVLNAWSSCVNDPSVTPNCHDLLGRYTKGDYAAYAGALLQVTPAGLHHVASGLKTLYAVSIDAGRILVLRNPSAWVWSDAADGSLAIYRSDGRLLQTLDVTASMGTVRDARLQGSNVAVLTRTAVAILDAGTGKTLRTWPLSTPASNVRLQDLHNGTAVFVTGRKVTLARLPDGKRAVIEVPGQGVVRAQLGARGLFYSYFADGSGRIAFIPTTELSSRFGR